MNTNKKRVEIVKSAIQYLLDAISKDKSDWSEEDINILEDLSNSEFKIIKKND